MPPKALKTAQGYYERAWRIVIRQHRPRWKETTIRKNLAWLWASRTQAEQTQCDALVAAQSTALPTIDQSILPQTSKRPNDPPHPRAATRGAQGGGAAPPAQDGAALPAQVTVAGPSNAPAVGANTISAAPTAVQVPPPAAASAPPSDPNNTLFPFWPVDNDDVDLPLATLYDEDRWMQAGFLLQGEEQHELDWHKADALGQGSGGRVTAWVKLDENDTIIDRVAVKDSPPIEETRWCSPFYWRDQLPRDIAIQKRLEFQGGSESIHKFRGYRLSMPQQCYRVYNELCNKGSYVTVLEYYSKQWRMRRNWYRLEIENDFDADTDPDDLINVKGEEGFPVDCDDLSVIPEKFLWHTFLHLVNACIFLRDGAGRALDDNRSWRPIVHKDLHLGNVFLKLPDDCKTQLVDAEDPEFHNFGEKFYNLMGRTGLPRIYDVWEFSAETLWPTPVTADYDTSFFDLQASNDTYADNPKNYFIYQEARTKTDVHGRYAPELFADHERYMTADQLPKLTSAADVFGIGAIMWNLLRNLPASRGYDQQPCFDHQHTRGRHLVNGRPYTDYEVDQYVLSGRIPYEASDRYSPELRNAVKDCLRYRPEDRATLDELKNIIMLYMNDDGLPTEAGDKNLWLFVPKKLNEHRMGSTYNGRKRKREEDSDSGE